MRFILYTIFTLGWFGMWWWAYVYHIKGDQTSPASTAQVQFVPDASLPLSFRWSDTRVMVSGRFNAWRDSIIASLRDDQIIQITGISYRDEVAPEGISDLGMHRAEGIVQAFGPALPPEKLILQSEIGEVTANIKGKNFTGYRMRVLTRNDEIREVSNCALVYFPYDSTTTSMSMALLEYVHGLAQRMRNSEESMKLVTLVQRQNQDKADTLLTQWRLVTLKNLIVNAGVADYRIAIAENNDQLIEQCRSELRDEMQQDWIAALFLK